MLELGNVLLCPAFFVHAGDLNFSLVGVATSYLSIPILALLSSICLQRFGWETIVFAFEMRSGHVPWAGVLVKVFIAVKRHHGHGNSYKENI